MLALSSAAARIVHCGAEQDAMDGLSPGRNAVPGNKLLRLEAEDAYSE